MQNADLGFMFEFNKTYGSHYGSRSSELILIGLDPDNSVEENLSHSSTVLGYEIDLFDS